MAYGTAQAISTLSQESTELIGPSTQRRAAMVWGPCIRQRRQPRRQRERKKKQQKKKELELDPGSWKCKLCSQLNPAANAKCRCCARPKDVILGQEKPKPTEIPLQHFRVYVSDFNQCDVTDTGSLNKEEALTLAKHQLGRQVTPEECEAWVEEMDADHDGLVTLDEYIEMVV